MRTRATDNGLEDGWRGARIGAELRDRQRRVATRVPAEVDIGEPSVPRVTALFLVLTTIVTLWEFQEFGASPSASDLARAGGSSLGAIATGEWWKLLSANVLHANFPHLALNLFFTYLVGRMLEHLAGRSVVTATILWSGISSSLLAIVLGGGAVSVGASGVSFGLMGCALALDPRGRTALGVTVRPLLIFNVIYTFIGPGVSVGGHLGGLLAGVLVGLACWHRAPSEDRPAGAPRRTLALAAIALAVPILGVWAVGPRVLPGEASEVRGRIVEPLLERELRGAQLTGGSEIGGAACEHTPDPLEYVCRVELDGADVDRTVRFAPGIDRWSL